MKTKTPAIRFAHYLYLPSEDYGQVREIWGRLTARYDVHGTRPDEVVGERALHGTPVVLQGDGVALGLLVVKGVTAIQVLYLSDTSLLAELAREADDISSGMEDKRHYIVGESTVAVLDEGDEAGLLELPLTNPKIYEGEVKGATLSIIRSADSHRHYYIVERHGEPGTDELFTSKLPRLDALRFKLAREYRYFRDQHRFISSKKMEYDRGMSDILNKWAHASSPSEETINRLDHDVETLSKMYSELVGSLRLVKNAHGTLARDVETLEAQAKSLTASPKDLADFKSALADDYVAFLQTLSADDVALHRSLDDTKATIEVVRTRIDIERSRESLLLQQEGVSVQVAAGFIELFIVGFYTLETWALLAGHETFEHIPAYLRLGIDVSFAVAVVAVTHHAARLLRKEKAGLGFGVSVASMVAALLLMVLVTSRAGG